MRTFIIRARKGTTRWDHIRSAVGEKGHIEVVAHTVINAFFVSNDFRNDVDIYIVLDSSEDFPRTIRLSSGEGLSLSGFHEEAVLSLLERVLRESHGIKKDETRVIEKGIQISGFGFEKCVGQLAETRPLYLLSPKGADIRCVEFKPDPVFILTDHIPMPKNTIKSLKRMGTNPISLGKKMLFASQCVVLIHHELDRFNSIINAAP